MVDTNCDFQRKEDAGAMEHKQNNTSKKNKQNQKNDQKQNRETCEEKQY